jgi:hypothetical protein
MDTMLMDSPSGSQGDPEADHEPWFASGLGLRGPCLAKASWAADPPRRAARLPDRGALQPTPSKVPGLHRITDAAAGNGFTIVKRRRGRSHERAAGNDLGSERRRPTPTEFIGQPARAGERVPQRVQDGGRTPAAGQDFVLMNGQGLFSFVLVTVGWRDDAHGQLDTGTPAAAVDPVWLSWPAAAAQRTAACAATTRSLEDKDLSGKAQV